MRRSRWLKRDRLLGLYRMFGFVCLFGFVVCGAAEAAQAAEPVGAVQMSAQADQLPAEAAPVSARAAQSSAEADYAEVNPGQPAAGIDVLIDVGHGGIDGGTSYGELLEKNMNLQMGQQLYEALQRMGISAALNRASDMAPSDDNRWHRTRSRHLRDLSQRKLVIESLRPKLTVSLHVNWSNNSRASGPGALHQGSAPSRLASRLFTARLDGVYGTNTVPTHGKTFYLLKHAPTPTIIVEMGYISNAGDRALLTAPAGQKKLADAMAAAAAEYLFYWHGE